jgi:D-galactarolactone cycloisomerase
MSKITDITAYVLECALDQPFAYSQAWFTSRTAILVRITTEDGCVGWGEAYGHPWAVRSVITSVLTPILLGQDALASERLWEATYNTTRDHGQKGTVLGAISAIDIALWDIKGKVTGLPVYRLLGGGFRDALTPYATGLYLTHGQTLESLADEARRYVDEGFTAMKMKVGFGIEEDTRRVRAVREAIGPRIRLMVDANHAYPAFLAIKLGRAIEGCDVFWFEEPVAPEDLAGYLQVKAALDIPIAGGEAEFTRFGFRELLSRRAVDIVQPDLCQAGGLTEGKKIAAMAEAWFIPCFPHVWGTAVGLAAGLHFAASLPDCPASLNATGPLLEFDRTSHPLRDRVVRDPIGLRDGVVPVPQGPGLGIEIDESALEHYGVNCVNAAGVPANR